MQLYDVSTTSPLVQTICILGDQRELRYAPFEFSRIAEKSILVDEVQAWEKRRNSEQVKIIWQFTPADARIK